MGAGRRGGELLVQDDVDAQVPEPAEAEPDAAGRIDSHRAGAQPEAAAGRAEQVTKTASRGDSREQLTGR